MNFTKGRRKGMGKVEFLANRPRILELMAQGYSSTMIYAELKENGHMTISFEQFWRYLSAMKSAPLSFPLASPSPSPALPALPVSVLPEAVGPVAPPKRKTRKRKTEGNASSGKAAALCTSGDMVEFNPQRFTDLNSTPESELDSEK